MRTVLSDSPPVPRQGHSAHRRLLFVCLLATGCGDSSPSQIPPVSAPEINLGEAGLPTITLSLTPPHAETVPIRFRADSYFNVTWKGPPQPPPTEPPRPFLVKILKPRKDGQLSQRASELVLQALGQDGHEAVYRVAVRAPWEAGEYRLQLQHPGKVLVDVPLLVLPLTDPPSAKQ